VDKRIELLERADVEQLITNKTPEGRSLEYKSKLPGPSDADKKEFLADIASFANASGGELYYGIEEERDANGKPTGIPDHVAPINVPNTDAAILGLESSIRDGIAPRLHGVRARFIPGFTGGYVLAMRVPQSWAAPHMVTYKSVSRFFSRGTNGKYPLDISEIRAAFVLSESRRDRLHSFRNERLGRLASEETPTPLQGGPGKLALHIVPFSALDPAYVLDLPSIELHLTNLTPIYDRGYTRRYNFDGILHFSAADQGGSTDYVQLFRNGSIEAVDTGMLVSNWNGRKAIPSSVMETSIVRALGTYLDVLQNIGIDPPLVVLLSLLAVKDYHILAPAGLSGGAYPIDRDSLLLPDILVEEHPIDASAALRPAFDALWQAAGYTGSPNYDKNGTWVVPK
jgi:Putative DNA-binding domain